MTLGTRSSALWRWVVLILRLLSLAAWIQAARATKLMVRGIPSLVTTGSNSRSTNCVEVIDLESRHLTPEAAVAAVMAFAGTRARIVYLKTDSTLRGNIAAELAAREFSLILASIEVSDVQGLFEEFRERGMEFAQLPTKQVWGGTDFHVRDPDGNVFSFVTYG